MKHLLVLAAGLLFGFGLIISGMANPAKVLNFLSSKKYLCFKHSVPLYNPNNWRKGAAWLPSSNRGEDILHLSSQNALCVHQDKVSGLPPAFRDQLPIDVSRDREEL